MIVKKRRRFMDQSGRMTVSQIIGAILLFSGILIMIVVGFKSYNDSKTYEETSSLIAIGFLMLMLGFTFYYPDMLEGPRKSISSMRVVVYMVVIVFVFIVVKIGWTAKDFASFTLDNTWAYIIAIALGSKAVQSLGENNWLGKRKEVSPGTPTQNRGLTDRAAITGANIFPKDPIDHDKLDEPVNIRKEHLEEHVHIK